MPTVSNVLLAKQRCGLKSFGGFWRGCCAMQEAPVRLFSLLAFLGGIVAL